MSPVRPNRANRHVHTRPVARSLANHRRYDHRQSNGSSFHPVARSISSNRVACLAFHRPVGWQQLTEELESNVIGEVGRPQQRPEFNQRRPSKNQPTPPTKQNQERVQNHRPCGAGAVVWCAVRGRVAITSVDNSVCTVNRRSNCGGAACIRPPVQVRPVRPEPVHGEQGNAGALRWNIETWRTQNRLQVAQQQVCNERSY